MGIHKDRPTIGFFTPFVSGHFLGSLCAELRKQCALNQLDLVVIMTDLTTDFDLPLALDYIDAAFITIDVVSPALVAQMLSRNIPIISSTEEYFPLEVEAVVSDQEVTVDLAFDHLYALGHRNIGFAGPLHFTDFRLRYESLLNCYRKKGLVFDPKNLLDVEDPGVPGGVEASSLYIERNCDCSALICGSDLTALGVMNVMNRKMTAMPRKVAVIGIDNNPLGQSCSPRLTTIDQCLDSMVAHVITRLLARLAGEPFSKYRQLITPCLVIRESCGGSQKSNNLDVKKNDYISSASYMQDCNELALVLGNRDYHMMLEISKIWGPFLKWLCLSKWLPQEKNDSDTSPLTLVDAISDNGESHIFDGYLNTKVQEEQFPILPDGLYDSDKLVCVTVVPITPEGLKWGVLTIIDELKISADQDAYNMFNYYLSLTSKFMQSEALTDIIRERERRALNLAEGLEVVANASSSGIWAWNLDLNVMEWNDQLLEMLGFTTTEEKSHYRNMSFLERIHYQDQDDTLKAIKEHLQQSKPFKIQFRMQAKSREYLLVEASGEAIRGSDGRVSRFVGALSDITEQHEAKQRIEYLAYHDNLTGLSNRLALVEIISTHIAQDPDEAFAIMLMDLNQFKQVNDTFGHGVGDAVLIHVADKLTGILRKQDHVSRYGGDEFVFKIPASTEIEALAIAGRILNAVKGDFEHEESKIFVEGCLGISLYPLHGHSSDELIRKADIAMYHAKNQRHNNVQFYHSEPLL